LALRIIDLTQQRDVRERVIIYSQPGMGKSRLALSLTERFGGILLYAADDGSEQLPSLGPEKHSRVLVVKPEGDDPIVNFQQFCMTDWSERTAPNGMPIRTIVVDTYTKIAMDSIQHSANTGAVTAEKHYRVGDPATGGQVIPNRGDYMAIDSLSRGYLDMLFSRQREMNIIFVCHEEAKQVEGVNATGGPAHPGRRMTTDLPARFSTVIRLIKKPVLVPGNDIPEDVVVAITDHDGKWIAKVRTKDETQANPLAQVILDRNPVNFWNQYDAIYAPKESK